MQKQNKKIYLDYAATTPIDPRVAKAMSPYFTEKFGNPGSLHYFGQQAKKALEQSRETIAKSLGAKSNEIIFTSSATESNNLAIKSIISDICQAPKRTSHIIVSSIEHPCIRQSANWLEKNNVEITRLPVNRQGLINPDDVKQAIKKNTVLVSIMHANNEIGTIQPIADIGGLCRKAGVLLHTDASQTVGKIPINVNKLNVDLLTASAHKMYGPKGVALLYVKNGVKLKTLLHGGGQEFGLRSSTVNVAGIVGFSKAVEICEKEQIKETKRLIGLRDKLIKGVLTTIPETYLTGHPIKRLPNMASFWFSFIEGESIVMLLDSYGVAASTGSACSSQKLEPSSVLLAIGLRPEQAHGSLRISLGRFTKPSDITYVLSVLPKAIAKLRKISPYKTKTRM